MTYRDIVGIPDPSKANVNSLAVNDPDAADLATHAASTAAHNLGATWEEKYVARGLSRSGLTVGQAGVFFEEFTDIARWQKVAGAASLTAVTTLTGGVAQLAAGIGDDVIYATGDGAFGASTVTTGTGQWYIAGRIRFPGALGAGCSTLLGLGSFAPQIVVAGYRNVTDTTHFCALSLVGGGIRTVISTIVIDAEWHDFELWHNAGNYLFSVDAETPLSLSMAAAPVGYMAMILEATGAGGAGITQQFDKLLCVFPQAA